MYLIYDDILPHCTQLKELLLSDPNNTEKDIQIACTMKEAMNQISKNTTVLFQDIKLEKNKNGIRFAEYVKNSHPQCLIVFITAYDKYWENVFSVMPSGFITKPFDSKKVARVVANINSHLALLNPMIYIKESENKVVSLHASDIIFIENENRRTQFYDDYYEGHKPKPIFSSHYSISEIEQFLPSCFIRCHVSYYINMNYIKELHRYSIELHNGKVIAISQRRYNEVKDAFFRFNADKM